MPAWTLYARDADNNLVGELDDYQKLEAVLRFNDVGTWTLDVGAVSPTVEFLSTPGAGIVVVRDGRTVISGPMTQRSRQRRRDVDTITFSGVDDTVWLARRLCSPEPASEGFYGDFDNDVYEAEAGDVLIHFVNDNVGPAAIADRRVPNLSVDTSGSSFGSIDMTGLGRWQTVLALCQQIATASSPPIGFRIRHIVGTGLVFDVYLPDDGTSTPTQRGQIFSDDAGNLGDYTHTSSAPTANWVYVGGKGDLAARVIEEVHDDASIDAGWGRIETFLDQRDTADTTLLDQAGAGELAKDAVVESINGLLLDLPRRTFGEDYNLGDTVLVIADDQLFTETVREVKITVVPGDTTREPTLANKVGEQIRAVVGTPGSTLTPEQAKKQAALQRRVANLERTK